MTTYTAALDALDEKAHRVHTTDDWRRVGEKAERAPASLTDDDLVILEGFGGPSSAAAARARREKALASALPPDSPATPATKLVHAPDLTWKTITDCFLKYSDTIFPILAAKFNKQEERIFALEARVAQLEQSSTAATERSSDDR